MKQLEMRWGVLFQDGALFSSQTVAENIQVPLREYTTMSQELMNEIASMKLTMVGLPEDTAHKYPSELSGGMRKRAGLARALSLDPELLFLDEPTSGLDPISANMFDELIKNLRQSLGLTVMMVTHDLDSLRAVTDRIAVLVDKKIVVGTIDELRKNTTPWCPYPGQPGRNHRHHRAALSRSGQHHPEHQHRYHQSGQRVQEIPADPGPCRSDGEQVRQAGR